MDCGRVLENIVAIELLRRGYEVYDEFINKMGNENEIDLNYFGIGICGEKKKINKLTGSMPLLR